MGRFADHDQPAPWCYHTLILNIPLPDKKFKKRIDHLPRLKFGNLRAHQGRHSEVLFSARFAGTGSAHNTSTAQEPFY